MEKFILTFDSGIGTVNKGVYEIPVQILCDNNQNQHLGGIDIDNKKIISLFQRINRKKFSFFSCGI